MFLFGCQGYRVVMSCFNTFGISVDDNSTKIKNLQSGELIQNVQQSSSQFHLCSTLLMFRHRYIMKDPIIATIPMLTCACAGYWAAMMENGGRLKHLASYNDFNVSKYLPGKNPQIVDVINSSIVLVIREHRSTNGPLDPHADVFEDVGRKLRMVADVFDGTKMEMRNLYNS